VKNWNSDIYSGLYIIINVMHFLSKLIIVKIGYIVTLSKLIMLMT
jgi:hypothetical protein